MDKAADMGKTTEQKQYEITAAEVGNAWNKLVGRYDLIESLMILINYLKDEDLRKEVKRIIKRLNQQVRDLENIMTEHTVALPPKPAAKYAILPRRKQPPGLLMPYPTGISTGRCLREFNPSCRCTWSLSRKAPPPLCKKSLKNCS